MEKILLICLSIIAGFILGAKYMGAQWGRLYAKEKALSDKYLLILRFLYTWLGMRQERKTMATYIEEKGYKEIAIYGMSYLGQRLYDELENTGVKVLYAIDQNADTIVDVVDVVKPDSDLPKVDAIIVTSIQFFGEIKAAMEKKVNCPIHCIEEFISPEMRIIA